MQLEYFVPIRQLPHLRKLTLIGLSCKQSAELSDALATLLPTLTTLTDLRLDAENNDDNVIALDMCALPISLESLTAIGFMALHTPKAIALPYLTKLCALEGLEYDEPTIFVLLMKVCIFISITDHARQRTQAQSAQTHTHKHTQAQAHTHT